MLYESAEAVTDASGKTGVLKIGKNSSGKIVAWVDESANVGDDLASFINKSLSQKLDDIATIWKTRYPIPDMLEGRTFFEEMMGYYRYTKTDGWAHTADIAKNFKGIDFYKEFFELENIITAKTAVSMKTTVTKDVNTWLNSTPIRDNISFLKQGLGEGFISNGKRFKIAETAKIDIYMPKENITPDLLQSWQTRFSEITRESNGKMKFEIKSIEEYIR